MTFEAAIFSAKDTIQHRGGRHGLYIVWSQELFDCPGHHFHLADVSELETVYAGAKIAAAVDKNGDVQYLLDN